MCSEIGLVSDFLYVFQLILVFEKMIHDDKNLYVSIIEGMEFVMKYDFVRTTLTNEEPRCFMAAQISETRTYTGGQRSQN